jgi:hypothetical protein
MTMQFMLLIHAEETPMDNVPMETRKQMSTPYAAYNEALAKAGALVGGERLAPSTTATIVRVRGEKTEVIDGPFADSKEQLGGFYVIEAADLGAAIAWAARCPGASRGTMEVRQIWAMKA